MRSVLGMALFFAIFFGILTGLHFYIFANLVAAGFPRGLTAAALWGLVAILFLSLPFSRLVTRGFPGALARACHWIGMTWMGSGFMLSFGSWSRP